MEKLINRWKPVIVFGLFLGLAACSSVPEQEQQALSNEQTKTGTQDESFDDSDPRDPMEGFNRVMWDFNYDILDAYILRPTAVVYRDYMPTPLRRGLFNMADNLDEPSAMVNNSLQGKFGNAGISLGRFLLNSTVGVLGLFDVATPIGLVEKQEDFGEVLGVWGVDNGPYIMLPAYGPTDTRDFAGGFVDGAYFPLSDLTVWGSIGRITVKALEGRISLMDQEQLLNDSFDPYLFVKEAHFQRSAFKVNDGKVVPDANEDEDDFDDFDDFDDEFEDL